jgi:EAL domain-containing protein (putative c-di-GMP-specific phosphodiesterase class I)
VPADLPIPATVRTGIYLIDDQGEHMGLASERSLLAQQSVRGRADRHIAVYDSAMHERTERERQAARDMGPVLESGQFVAYVQPQYDHDTRSIVSAEALVRWVHPTRGLIPPDEFIPVFERNGFISRLDASVWEQVCAWMARRREAGLPTVPISVNISRAEMEDDTILGTLDRLLGKYSVDPACLRLEVTEGAYGETSAQVIGLTRRLVERGFLVEMDDFGKGSSSLNSLKDIPVDILKLDMRFLSPCRDEEVDERGDVIVSSVIRMAHDLDMDVVAEGVETQEQSDRLAAMGCNVMQGFLYARPMPLREFEGLLDA